jgi:iron complex outermembrane receptor protein
LQEIVVTAQRRSENMQRVPIAITAVSGDTLVRQGITQAQGLVAVVPGLSIGQANGPTTQIYLRGVGTSSANAYSDNAVAFNVDGVYIARNTGLGGQLYDLERVEVLKGPQGTLYGRNATGGAINVITEPPSLNAVEGNVSLEVGDYGLVHTNGALNIPVSATFALRVAGQLTERNGYFSDGYDDDKSGSARVRALWQPNTDFSILLNTDYSHTGGQGSGSVLRPFVDPSNPWLGSSTPAAKAVFSTDASPLPLAPPANDGFVRTDSGGVSAEINWTSDLGKLTIEPAYRDLQANYRDYVPGFRNDIIESANQTSLEARFATDDTKPLSILIGTFIFHENRTQDNTVDQTITGSRTLINALPTDAYAVFGQLRYKLTDRLRLTGGLRYTVEEKSLDGSSIALTGATTPLDGKLTFHNVSWRAGAEFDATRNSLIYANISTGFKAGGFYTDLAPDNTYRPEELTSYVIGSKNTLFDGLVRLNFEGFWWDYKDHQESHLAFGNAGIVFKTENVGKATMRGAETELDVKVGPLGRLTVRGQYLDATFNSFSYTTVSPIGAPRTGCDVAALGGPSYRIDCGGMPATRAPKWSGTTGYQQGVELPAGWRLAGAVDVEFASGQYLAIDYVPEEWQATYALVNLSLSLSPPSRRWSLTGWVRNVGDKAVLNAATQQLFAPGITLVDLRPPRTFGSRLSYSF